MSVHRRSIRTGNDVRTQVRAERVPNDRRAFRRRIRRQRFHVRDVAGRHRLGVRATGFWIPHFAANLHAPVSHEIRPIRRRVHHAQR